MGREPMDVGAQVSVSVGRGAGRQVHVSSDSLGRTFAASAPPAPGVCGTLS